MNRLTGEEVEKKLRDMMQRLNIKKKSEEKFVDIRGFVEEKMNNSIGCE